MAEAPAPIEVFCCYSRKDETWLRKLETHLSLLQRQGFVSLWHDRLIVPGADRAKSIDTHLETASVILLLVSADFLASDYCYSIEMKRALERDVAGEARVVPILVRSVDWKNAPFAHLQALPTNAKPVADWQSQDQALADVTAEIRRVIENLSLPRASAPRTALPPLWNDPSAHDVVEASLAKEGQKAAISSQGLLAPIPSASSQSASSPWRSPLVIFILLALILLSGGNLIYRAAIGHFLWQASLTSTSILPGKTTQPGASGLGRSWHSGNLDNSGDLSGVAWSDSRFVAVGGSCRLFFFFCSSVIFTSPDGITWTSQNSTTSQHLSSVAWSGSRFVAVGNSGTVLTSSDGITWTSQDSSITGDLSDVAWSNSRFVAAGGSCRLFSFFCSDTIFTSPDGITWTSQHTSTNQHLHRVTWSGSRFVAVGNSGTIFTSPDGITWTSQSSGTAVDLLSVVWSGSRFVAVGDNGTILTSSDGITWTPQHPPTTKNLDDIVWSGSRFVTVGSSGTILTSPDGIAWTSQDSGTSQDLDDIVWSGSRFVTVGISGVISTSP